MPSDSLLRYGRWDHRQAYVVFSNSQKRHWIVIHTRSEQWLIKEESSWLKPEEFF